VFKCKTKREQQSTNSFHTVKSMIFCTISVSWVKFAWQSTSRYACHFLITLYGTHTVHILAVTTVPKPCIFLVTTVPKPCIFLVTTVPKPCIFLQSPRYPHRAYSYGHHGTHTVHILTVTTVPIPCIFLQSPRYPNLAYSYGHHGTHTVHILSHHGTQTVHILTVATVPIPCIFLRSPQ
jgi:hypothetical protein